MREVIGKPRLFASFTFLAPPLIAGIRSGAAGRKPRLDARALQRLEAALLPGPLAWGYSTHLWTLQRVAQVIRKVCQVRYHPRHVGRVLHRLGWSRQRPARRARERNEAAIRRWVRVRWPQVKKTPSA